MRRKKPDKRVKPEPLASAVSQFIDDKGLRPRVDQAAAIDDWPEVVGPQIATISEALSITPDGTLFISVKTHAWMNELSLMEPELLRLLNLNRSPRRVKKIRFQLKR